MSKNFQSFELFSMYLLRVLSMVFPFYADLRNKETSVVCQGKRGFFVVWQGWVWYIRPNKPKLVEKDLDQMKHIIMVQHTQSVHHTNAMVGSWTDWDLTELGNEQADHIGKRLADEFAGKEVILYSSNLKRAMQTAEEIAKYLGIEPIFREELRERNLGKCCGKSVQWLRENAECEEKTIGFRIKQNISCQFRLFVV